MKPEHLNSPIYFLQFFKHWTLLKKLSEIAFNIEFSCNYFIVIQLAIISLVILANFFCNCGKNEPNGIEIAFNIELSYNYFIRLNWIHLNQNKIGLD